MKKDKVAIDKINYIAACLASDFRIPHGDPRRTMLFDHAVDFCAENDVDVFDYKGELKLIKELKDRLKKDIQL